MEALFKLSTPDGKEIQGTVRAASRRAASAIVFVHGITGHSSEHIFYNAARFFPHHGIDAIRFDLYPGGPTGRLLPQCALSTHAGDVNLVLKHFRKLYKNLFLVGHSLGGPTVLSSNLKLADAVLLWAPACSEVLFDPKVPLIQLIKGTELYKTCWAVEAVVGRQMAREMLAFPKSQDAAKRLELPVFVACGENDVFLKGAQNYHDFAPGRPRKFCVIKGGGHQFNEGDTALELYAQTQKFIARVLKQK